MSCIITLTHDTTEGVIQVVSPYNARFVDELKVEIPVGSRKWDKEYSCWSVDADYQEYLEDLLDRHYEGAHYEWEEY